MDANVAWAAVGAVGSVAAAGVAAWAAYQSRRSAEQANAAAGTLTAIEEGRRHGELAPEFEIVCTVRGPDADSATLHVMMKPGALGHLDEEAITILDEAGSDHWARGLPDGITREEAEAFVWGPWQFSTGVKQVECNRATTPRPYSVVTGKNWDVLPMTRTRPGHWMDGTSQAAWRKQNAGKPVRLLLTCRRDGYWPWVIQRDVEVTVTPRARLRWLDT